MQRRARTWWWFLVPALTCGFGTFAIVLYGGLRIRRRGHAAMALVYLLLTAYFFIGVQYTPTNGGTFPDWAIMPAFLAVWLGGTAHALFLQLRAAEPSVPVSERPSTGVPVWEPLPPTAPALAADPALVAAQQRLQRRQEARAILRDNPPLAAELRIGRPDRDRAYDDGGLIDINHVPASVLVAELELAPAVAATVVSERDRLGGFGSPEELVVYSTGLTADRLALIADRLVFVPL